MPMPVNPIIPKVVPKISAPTAAAAADVSTAFSGALAETLNTVPFILMGGVLLVMGIVFLFKKG